MADRVIPAIPKAELLYAHSGNICTWQLLKNKINQLPSDEVYECLSSCVEQAVKKFDATALQYQQEIRCLNDDCLEKLPSAEEERDELKLTVKVFLASPKQEALVRAMNCCLGQNLPVCDEVREDLGVSFIDSLLISFPPGTQESEAKDIWAAVEMAVQSEQLLQGGVCDMDVHELQALMSWAQVKPSVDQVNLSSCCVMPPELVEFAKDNEITLLTHNDPAEVMTKQRLQALLAEQFSARDAEGWNLEWIIRYTVLVKLRGIIKSKGYIMLARRDTQAEHAD